MSFTRHIACLGLLAAFATAAEVPQGYYDACKGKCESALKSQLYTIVKDHTAISYGDATWSAFRYTDVAPGTEYWEDVYTLEHVDISGHSGMNIEHSFPKSWWGGTKNDAYKDIVHLMPVNEWANNDRSNHPFAEVQTEKAPNYRCPSPNYRLGSPVSGQGGGDNIVFEPADEYKGDLARTYFYMVTCYQDLSWSTDGLRTAQTGIYPTLQPWAQEMLLRWHRQDPVSDKERRRNEGVYSQQQNRNPFIDHPEMVEHIWGTLKDTPWTDGDTPVVPPILVETPEITSPVHDDLLSFTTSKAGESVSHVVPVLGRNIEGQLTAAVEGPDASLFSIMVGSTPLPALSLQGEDVCSQQGCNLTVRYLPAEPTESAPHAASLKISGDELENPVVLNLQGTCLAASVTVLPVYNDSARFFTLQGVELPDAPAAPGIYIMVAEGKSFKYIKQ